MLRPIPEINDNPRFVPLASGPGFNAVTTKRDPIQPVPIGTYVVMCFRVTGYDEDCDGSLMGRYEHVDRKGEATGWEPTHVGLYPETALVVEHPAELWTTSRT